MEVRAADDLYGVPLEEFVSARDALARQLKASGDKDAAAAVKKLRKPTRAAWALNQAARRHPDDLARLLDAAAGVRGAQEEALAGDAGGLREATRVLGDEIDHVAGIAVAALPASSAENQRDRIVSTLRAAAVDEAGADLLRRGVLVEDLEPTGFGLGFGAGGDRRAPEPRGTGRRGAAARGNAKPSREAVEAVEVAKRDLRRAEAEAESAETRARRRAERAETAARRAQEAQREAEQAQAEAEDAAGEAAAARRRAGAAAARLGEAEAALES